MDRSCNTDEAVIQQYALLYDCYGDTPAFCKALDKLKIAFKDPEKQAVWKGLIEGVKFQADKRYDDSLVEFEKIEPFINKNTLLHLFFQRQKLFSYVFSPKNDVKDIRVLYNPLIDQYKDNPDPFIQWQVTGTMLDESYVAWEIGDETEELKKVDDELIRIYGDSPVINIQVNIAKTMNNKVIDLLNMGLDIEAFSLLDMIVERYQGCNEARITKQVVRALDKKAYLYYEDDNLEKARLQYKEIVDTYSGRNDAYIFEDFLIGSLSGQVFILAQLDKKIEALDLFNTLYNFHINSDNLNVQYNLILMVLAGMALLKEIGQFDQQIRLADKTIKQFQKIDDASIQLKVLDVMFEKAETYYQQGQWYKEVDVYNGIIDRSKNENPPPSVKKYIFRAMRLKVASWERMGDFEEAIRINKEAINFLKESKKYNDFNLVVLFKEQTDLLMKAGRYDEYLTVYNDIFERYITSDDIDIRNVIIKFIFNRAYYEGVFGKQQEKKRLYRQIIDLFRDDTDNNVVEVVTNTMLNLGILLRKEKDWDEAIRVLTGAKKYLNYDNDVIQIQIACSLCNRIKYMKTKGSESEEIRAACEEFIEIFKLSGEEKIKEMISDVESNFMEKAGFKS